MMNDSDPHLQAMQSSKDSQIHQRYIVVRDCNPLSTSPDASTLASTRSAHGGQEQLSPVDRESALRHIKSLENHNTKLYEDNCQLVNAVNMLNDRLAFVGASQNTQVLHLAEIQEKLRASEMNRGSLNRKYQELLCGISANSAHHHLAVELAAIRKAYTELDQAHRILGGKYINLKAVVEASRQQFHGTPPAPHVARGFHPVPPNRAPLHPDQHRINAMSPPSALSPPSMHNPMAQQQTHRRRNSEGVIIQPPGPPPLLPIDRGLIATTWLPPLPTPPPSASVEWTKMSSTGFFIHSPTSAGPPPPHHQRGHGTRTMSGPPILTNRHVQESAIKIPEPPLNVNQRRGEVDPANVVSSGAPTSTNPRSLKRPKSDMQPSASPEGGNKRPRIEEEAQTRPEKPASIGFETDPIMVPSPVAEGQNGSKPATPASGDDVRSYEECVNLIFEKDADIENGIFCGLCLNRYEAEAIPEPPDVLVQPDFDSLVRHCMTMHPGVWEDLRHRKTQRNDADSVLMQ